MFCGIASSNLLFLSLLLVLGPFCLISLRYKSWRKQEQLYSCYSEKTCSLCCYSSSSEYFGCQNGILLPLFIGFNLNTLSNSLLSPVLHVATLIPLSIDCAHPCNPSNAPSIAFPVLIFCASVLLPLYILLLH